MKSRQLRIHAGAIAAIIALLVLMAYLSQHTDEVVVEQPYSVIVSSASYGLNCKRVEASASDPYVSEQDAAIRPNNVIARITELCNNKPGCSFVVNTETLGKDPAPRCTKRLEVEYRCFSYDRPWTVKTDEYKTLTIDCTRRSNF